VKEYEVPRALAKAGTMIAKTALPASMTRAHINKGRGIPRALSAEIFNPTALSIPQLWGALFNRIQYVDKSKTYLTLYFNPPQRRLK